MDYNYLLKNNESKYDLLNIYIKYLLLINIKNNIYKNDKKYRKNKNLKIENLVHVDDNNKEAIKDFEGLRYGYLNWIECFYCGYYYPKIMFLNGDNNCAHCWGWLNEQQLQLTEGIYNGYNTFNEVKQFLKLTYHLHENINIKCYNNNCIYNKIKSYYLSNKLNPELCILLTFTNNINNEFKIKSKNNLKINYKLSKIVI